MPPCLRSCEHETTMDTVQEKAVTPAAPHALGEPSGPPKMYRRRSGRAVAGVAVGLADHLGVRVLWVRATFAVLAAFGGAGLVAYGLLWVFAPQLPTEDVTEPASPRDRQQALALLLLGIGLAVGGSMFSGLINGWVAVPLAVALFGAAVVWREADESQRRRWRDGARSGVAGVMLGGGGWSASVRILAGAALVVTGVGLVILRNSSFDQIQFALIAVLATLIGVAVLTVPFWLRMVPGSAPTSARRSRRTCMTRCCKRLR